MNNTKKINFNFPNRRIILTQAGLEFIGVKNRKAAKDWCARFDVPLVKHGVGKQRDRWYVFLYDLQEGMQRESEEFGHHLPKPAIEKKATKEMDSAW